MAKEKLEDIGIDILMKRKKFAFFLIGVMIGIFLVTLVSLGVSIADEKEINVTVYVPGLILIFFILIMYNGVKKINSELQRRDKNK